MKLLVVTQKVDKNDDILGFFHKWLVAFARCVDSLLIICLEEREHDLPENVKVYSLGKEKGASKLSIVLSFYKYVISHRKEYDTVFVHMNPEYLVLGGFLWRLMSKKIGLWYVHKQVNLKLRVGAFFAHHIFTASKYSYRLKSKKVNVVGHGIDVEQFRSTKKIDDGVFRLLTVGRISRSKQADDLIHTAYILKELVEKKVEVVIVGKYYSRDDEKYYHELKQLVNSLGMNDMVVFTGGIPNTEVHKYYAKSSVTVNPSLTGGIDKVVLEAVASRTPTMVSYEAFGEIFGDYRDLLTYELGNHNQLAEKMVALISHPDLPKILDELSTKINKEFGIETLIPKIIDIYEASR